MIIRSIKATPVNVPFVAPYRFSYGAIASLTKTVIELQTEDGVVGLGECADGDRAADIDAMGARLVGRDIRLVTEAERLCVPGMAYSPWDNVQAKRRVFGGIEMAMWDARGKTEGLPLWHLLGGKVRDEIALTEYFAFRDPGPAHPGEATPVEIAKFCAEMIDKHDAQIFEGKLATFDLATEVDMVREVRAAIGDRELRLDANGGWVLTTAKRAIKALGPYDVAWYEEPVESYEEMAALRSVTDAGLSSHRIDLRRAVELGAPDAIVTNINELGGMSGAVDFIRSCARFDIGFRFHSGETGVASAAYLHLSAALEPVREASQTLLRWYADDVIEGGPMQPRSGTLPVPTGPGLGVAIDPKALARCHQRYCDEGAFPAGQTGGGYGGNFRKR
ncbi:mandelate racemase/muconate lactonizing enzyme family protein [Roseovarius rhodophyticola]|uniref:glucarate dehydratase n=1 Tax=Roseovarius rhodophyticola TaxID=3080827 RepID=A0ABZ2TMJ0_9RHOB|nr:mandelate racemase/muconate lactonizing enzyme family protein [Roseovarius sp. W115]MDV2929304.1 mandelate racemase/muconate lactonizing enzyme family protein [Roseovarius sp. W115]